MLESVQAPENTRLKDQPSAGPEVAGARAVVRFDSLTSLRFFAALMVAIHHTRNGWAHTAFTDFLGQVGWLGVSFFFVLSGFVLMWGHTPSMPFKAFMLRRLIRIYPLHIVTLAFSLAAYFAIGNPLAGYVGNWWGTIASVFLVHGWVPLHPEVRQAWNGVSWTLSCELFFYLCAPFLFPYLSRTWRSAIWALIAIWFGLLVLCAAGQNFDFYRTLDFLAYSPFARILEFALGAVAALHLRSGALRIPVVVGVACLVVPIGLYCYLVPENLRAGALMMQLATPGSVLIVYAAASSDLHGRSRLLRSPVLVFLGEASFALYMIHALFLALFTWGVTRLFPEVLHSVVRGEVVRLVYLTYAVLLSAACYWYFEHPLRLWLLKTIGQSRSFRSVSKAGVGGAALSESRM